MIQRGLRCLIYLGFVCVLYGAAIGAFPQRSTTTTPIRFPDLNVIGMTVEPKVVELGRSCRVEITIRNDGPLEARGFDVRLEDTARSVFEKTSVYVWRRVDLGAGKTTVLQTAFTPQKAGSAKLVARANPDKSIAESGYANNELSFVLEVRALPDLRLESMSITPASAELNTVVKIALAAKNVGKGPARGFTVEIRSGSSLVQEWKDLDLSPGQTWTQSFDTAARPEGLVELVARVDPAGRIAESDEDNNVRTAKLNVVSPRPDLVLNSFQMDTMPALIGPDSRIKLTWEYGNKGQGWARGFKIQVLLNNDPIYTSNDPIDLPPSSQWSSNYKFIQFNKKPAGSYVFSCRLDSDNQVDETDENNNVKNIPFEITPPDLVISGVRFEPLAPTTEDDVSIGVSLRNQGKTEVHLPIGTKTFAIQGLPIGEVGHRITADTSQAWMSWNRSQEYWVKFASKGQLAAGTYSFTVRADPDQACQPAESDRSNNEKTVSLTIAMPSNAKPDLIIDRVDLPPGPLHVNVNVELAFVIKNIGTAPAVLAGHSNPIKIEDGADLVSSYPWLSGPVTIAPGETYKYYLIGVPKSAGTFTYRAIVDPNNYLTLEADKSNNATTFTITIVNEPRSR